MDSLVEMRVNASVYNVSEGTNAMNTSGPVFIFGGPLADRVHERQFSILVPSFVYTALLMLVGMPGNALVIIVYLLKMSRTTSRHFIISLAVCDFINCAFGMPVELSLLANYYVFDIPVLCKVSRFTTFFMNSTSSLVLLGIAVDRFRRVCRPLRPNMTVYQSKVICIAAAVFSLLSSIPALGIYGTWTWNIPLNNTTFVVLKTCLVEDSMRDTVYPMAFITYTMIGTVVIFIALAVIYAFVGRAVYRNRNVDGTPSASNSNVELNVMQSSPSVLQKSLSRRLLQSLAEHSPQLLKKSTSRQDMEGFRPRAMTDVSIRKHGGRVTHAGRTTTILALVTFCFMLSFLPYFVTKIMRYTGGKTLQHMSPTESSFYNIALRSYILNSAVNPIIYCFLNPQFRLKVKLLFSSFLKCRSKT